tara:strand:- start:182 stop:442 length:261 start_codon:yes stop_codon:yes gene_type:complete
MTWTEADVGKQVTITEPHGTTYTDEIVALPYMLPAIDPDGQAFMLGTGEILIGPSLEVGMILARASMALPAIHAQREQRKKMEDFE